MTIAHASSVLGIKDYPIAIDFKDILFPFYWNKVSGRAHEPTIDVSTMIPDDRWGMVLAVEDGTTNLYTSQSTFSANGVTASYDSNTKTWTMTVPSGSTGSWRGIAYNQTNAVFSPGEKGTVSCEVFADESGIPLNFDVNNYGVSYSTGINDNDIVSNRVFRVGETVAGKWVKISVTFEFSSSATQNFHDQTRIIFGNGWVPSGDKTIKIRNIQCEKKAWPTSFVEGTRGTGRVQYPKEIFPPLDFTLNMWIAHTGDTRTNNSAMKLFALDQDITKARLTLWNYCPISSDSQNRRIIADFGNDSVGTRQFLDLVHPTLFVPHQWEMLTVTLDYANKTFRFYRNGILWGTRTVSVINPINAVELYNSGWKYSNLLITPRVASNEEILAWYEYGKPFYDPYNYYAVYA